MQSAAKVANSLAFSEEIITRTKLWLEHVVIGLNFCPFAKAVFIKEQIRYVVSMAQTPQELLGDLILELHYLQQSDSQIIDTTLLIHPHTLQNFLDYNDFLSVTEATLDAQMLTGEIQIASFHPEYQFADNNVNDVENYTNRSPFPMLHLLREVSVERAISAFPDTAKIVDRNIQTLRRLNRDQWKKIITGGKYYK